MKHRKRLAVLSLVALAVGLLVCSQPAPAATVTISPEPGTPTATPRTQISFLGAAAGSLHSISVVGSSSGRHRGRLRSYSSATGASFLPSKPFTAGEHVTVHAILTIARGRQRALSTFFAIAHSVAPPNTEFPATPGTPAEIQSFHSQPGLHPPAVIVHKAAGAGSAPGYVFASPFLGPGQWGPMIFDNAGNLVWFRPIPGGQDAADFRTQVYRGRNYLTWWQGRTITLGYGLGEDVIANANYRTVAVVRAGNGLAADEHDFIVLRNGAALIAAYEPVQADLSSAGGSPGGVAVDCVVQEIDIHTGLVMWEWHSLGHVAVSESYSKLPADPAAPFDYFHLNSIQPLAGGNILISARNTWGVYEISGHTGAVMWRLGGKRSTFALGPGVQFAYQHNALLLAHDRISLFDDEGAPPVHPPSRGEFIKLNLKTKTATLAGQLVRSIGPLITNSQGDVQSLAGGGWMVGWGGLPNLTEFDASGQVIYDAQLPSGENSYRVYREPWSGQPSEPPAIAARTTGSGMGVYASWNGATAVAAWQLLAGASASALKPVSTTPKSGFETTIPATPSAFVQVRALDASGKALGTSAVVAPTSG